MFAFGFDSRRDHTGIEERSYLCNGEIGIDVVGWITLKESGRPDSKGGPGSPAAQEPLLAPTAIEVASRVKPQNVQHWSFPVAFRERLRCAIFEDLHSKGYANAMESSLLEIDCMSTGST